MCQLWPLGGSSPLELLLILLSLWVPLQYI